MGDTFTSWLGGIPAASKPASQLLTCLYVEDSKTDILLVEQLIARRNDLILLTANTGLLGLKMAQDQRPDIILMDIDLPGANGVEVLALLRADRSTAQIPVTALSSNAYPHQIEAGLRSGFFHYLTKPFKIAEFMVAINAMLLHANKLATLQHSPGVWQHHRESAIR